MTKERLERGIKKINELLPDADQGILTELGKTASDLANYILKFIFRDLQLEQMLTNYLSKINMLNFAMRN